MKNLVILICLLLASNAWATKIMNISGESVSCNTAVGDGTPTYDGYCFDWLSGETTDTPYWRCSLDAPLGSNYLENIPSDRLIDALVQLYRTNCSGVAYSLSNSGYTYYLAGFFRFERIGGNDIWEDSGYADSFDKLHEMRGNNYRWGIDAGWRQGMYNATDHKFTFSIWWGHNTGMPNVNCNESPSWNDSTYQNVSPYSRTSPYLCDYEKWYAVVLKIVNRTDNTGTMDLYINGTHVTSNSACRTSESNPDIYLGEVYGTIAQPDYNAPTHKRQADGLVIAEDATGSTTEYDWLVSNGYFSDPEGGVTTTVPATSTIASTTTTSILPITSTTSSMGTTTVFPITGITIQGVTLQ